MGPGFGKDKFKSLLDDHYQWPCEYIFKFVVPKDGMTPLKTVFSRLGAEDKLTERQSTTGRYKSMTISLKVNSSEEVLQIYEDVRQIEGIVCL